MRHRKRLSELSTVNRKADHLIEKVIGIVVKAFYICAGKKQERVSGAAKIEIGCVTAVDPAEITQRQGRPGAFSMVKDALHSERHVTCPIFWLTLNPGMREQPAAGQQFDAARYGELHYLIETPLRRELGRVGCTEKAGFKLKIAHRSQSSRRGDGGAAGIGDRIIWNLSGGNRKKQVERQQRDGQQTDHGLAV